jgi:hypothetical protein
MLVFALSAAQEYTIVSLFIWGVFFPALVTGLIGIALAGVARERTENEESRNSRRRG